MLKKVGAIAAIAATVAVVVAATLGGTASAKTDAKSRALQEGRSRLRRPADGWRGIPRQGPEQLGQADDQELECRQGDPGRAEEPHIA